jgi:pimeloyl-ACP methyl ester carboxylesterase
MVRRSPKHRINSSAIYCCYTGEWASGGSAHIGFRIGAEVMRIDFFVESDPTTQLAVREVTAPNVTSVRSPVILIHGARVPGLASFDLKARNGSLAVELSGAGLRAFIMDARGYGGSTRTGQDGDPVGRPPLARSNEIVRDIVAVTAEVRKRTGAHQVALFGWATGGHWAGMFASRYPEVVSHLAILNSLYGRHTGHPTLGPGGRLTDKSDPSRLDSSKVGAFGFSTAASLRPAWDASIPVEDKSVWRDPAVLDAYETAALASDPESGARNPPSFRAPTGAMADSFELASGRKLWDASSITARVLLLRSEYDFWSREADLDDLARDLIHARSVKAERLVGATHFVHLDRAEHGRDALVKELISFLTAP